MVKMTVCVHVQYSVYMYVDHKVHAHVCTSNLGCTVQVHHWCEISY